MSMNVSPSLSLFDRFQLELPYFRHRWINGHTFPVPPLHSDERFEAQTFLVEFDVAHHGPFKFASEDCIPYLCGINGPGLLNCHSKVLDIGVIKSDADGVCTLVILHEPLLKVLSARSSGLGTPEAVMDDVVGVLAHSLLKLSGPESLPSVDIGDFEILVLQLAEKCNSVGRPQEREQGIHLCRLPLQDMGREVLGTSSVRFIDGKRIAVFLRKTLEPHSKTLAVLVVFHHQGRPFRPL